MSVSINDHSQEYMDEVNRALEAALTGVGMHIEGEAKEELENAPRRVDTGNLKSSINYEVDTSEKAVYIGTDVEYALYVHVGTSRMPPNRYLTNAVEHNLDQITRYLEDALK